MKNVWTIAALFPLVSLIALTATAKEPAIPAPPASPVAPAESCPVTRPNGDMPPGSGNPEYIGGYGNDALWTNVWMWGEGPVQVQPDPDEPGRTWGPGKWAWYRYVSGQLTIEGRRLDGPAPPLEAHIPDGYGNLGFQVSGLDFPTPGCWEVTGRVGEDSLTFVVLVELAGVAATPDATT